MPNWCESTYVFIGDKKSIDEFESKINEAMETDWDEVARNYPMQDFGCSWLGNILFAYCADSQWQHLRLC